MIITDMPYTRVMVPTGGTNKRKVMCRRCRWDIRIGQGIEYECTMGSYLIISGRAYLCPRCAEKEERLQELMPEITKVIREIEAWCIENVQTRLGSVVADRVRAMVYSAELDGLEVARAILEAIKTAPDTGFGTVIDVAKATALEVVNGRDHIA